MTKSHREMLFTAIVGTTLQIIWLFLFPQTSKTDYFSYYTTLVNFGTLPLIIVQFIDAKPQPFQSLLSLLLIIVFSPLVWFFIGFQFQISFLFETLYFRYSPLGITAALLCCQLIKIINNRKSITINQPNSPPCPYCTAPLSPNSLFCNNCKKMTEKVTNIFTKFPQKHHLDFAERSNQGYRHCPHCDEITVRTFGIVPHMGSPIRLCNNCQNVYLSNLYCEWSVTTLSNKIILCMFDGAHIFICFLLVYGVFEQALPISIGLISLAIIVFLRVLWFFTISIFEIRESKSRLKANPEYPKILMDMGYEHMNGKYTN